MNHQVLIIGHRGWPTRFPDNTLAGFLAASAVVGGVEMDVRRSKDGKLVLAHDAALAGHSVPGTPWAVLAELDLGHGHHPVLLDEALAALPETRVQLEIKNSPFDKGFEPDHRLALEAAERSRPGDTLTSFNPQTIETVRRVFPDVTTGLAVDGDGSLLELVNYCLDAGHDVLVPNHQMVTEPLDFAGHADVSVYPYTVNTIDRAAELATFGVSGIITDNPGAMAEYFEGVT